jgi:anaerobic dimethyl sulfoxide reductase subunit A
MVDKSVDEQVEPTVVCQHCGSICLLKVHTKGGVITRVEPDDGAEPQLRACARGYALKQKVHDPTRVQYPMKRVGKRGEGKFERISWDEAFDTVAHELKRVRDTYGPQSILQIFGGGDIAMLNTAVLGIRFFNMFGGSTTPWGMASFEGANLAALSMLGNFMSCGNSRDDLLNSKLIIMWGWNPAVTVANTNTTWYLSQAKEKGIKIVCVDPRHTESVAIYADQWIPIRPSTDAAMLIAMAHVIIRDGLDDKAFLERYTVGFDKYKAYVMGEEDGEPKTPEWAESITGVPAPVIEALAKEYATGKPAALITGIAPGRTAYGEQYHRAAVSLAAITGNTGVHGGHPGAYPGGFAAPVNPYSWLVIPPMPGDNPVDALQQPRKLHMQGEMMNPPSSMPHRALAADALLKGKAGGYPTDYKLFYMYTNNVLNQLPNSNKWAQALMQPEVVIIHEVFFNATARYADILLPASLSLERNDLTYGGATPFFGYMKMIVDPPGEAKSYFDFFKELAARFGIEGFLDQTEDETIKGMLVFSPQVTDYEQFKKDAVLKIDLPEPHVGFKAQIDDPDTFKFGTPSGKIEIYSEQIADANVPGCPPIPKYINGWEGPGHVLVEKYPLQLITTHARRRSHTQLENVPWLLELEEHAIVMHTSDAESRGIRDGDQVLVFNDRGKVRIPARVTERIMPGVVDLGEGAWYKPDEDGVDVGGCANTLTSDIPSPGGSFAYNTSLVQVEKV